jgi:hypothetical protein
MKTFAEFWPFYMGQHKKLITRRIHALGLLCFALVAWVGWSVGRPLMFLPLAWVAAYACAWVGHFGFEGNRPAMFKHPIWSFVAYWKMVGLIVSVRMTAEMKRLNLEA